MIDLQQGDCLELMKDIPDKSVDMILCDLPYGTTANKWDIVIPFEPLWEQYNRVIKHSGAIVLFASMPFTANLVSSNTKGFKYSWIWNKHAFANQMQAHYAPLKVTEDILVFTKDGKKANYNPQNLIEINQSTRQGEKVTENIGGGTRNKIYKQKYTNYPRNILSFKRDNSRLHPTQKPIPLLEYLIKTYTHEGETVLDNCMGSGSTGVACVNTGRSFIGMELEEKYFEIAEQRINEARRNVELF